MSQPENHAPTEGRFLSGDMMGHVLTMTFTAAIGLVAMFAVDLVSMMFISWLGDPALVAGIGFAGTILFFNGSLSVALMIASSALVARRVGMGKPEDARAIFTDVLVVGMAVSVPSSLIFWLAAEPLMGLMGAQGRAAEAGVTFMRINLLFAPIVVSGMIGSGFLRGHGLAQQAMLVTLAMAITNLIVTPLMLFVFKLGIAGAAWSNVAAGFVMVGMAYWPIVRDHGGLAPFDWQRLRANLADIRNIMLPSVVTNLATPLGGLISFRYIAEYGTETTSAFAIIGRIVPAAFCLIFALSGAVGPIVGQNFGAGNFDRVREALRKSLLFTFMYVMLIWPVLWFSSDWLSGLFGMGETGRAMLQTYVTWVTPLFLFTGMLFVANAAFNNLGKPQWSSLTNWGRNTLGIVPFAWAGSALLGADGVLIGQGIGGIPFGILAYLMTQRLVDQQERLFAVKLPPADQAEPLPEEAAAVVQASPAAS